MDELLTKSQLNTEAAQILFDKQLYSSACHPIYYSCLQLISYKLIRCGLTLDAQSSLSSKKYYGKSHKCLIEESRKRIKCSGHREEKEFKDGLYQLKELREKADYKEDVVMQQECQAGMDIAKLLIQKINTINY